MIKNKLQQYSNILEEKGYPSPFIQVVFQKATSGNFRHEFYTSSNEQWLYQSLTETDEEFFTRIDDHIQDFPTYHDSEVKKGVNKLEQARSILEDCGEEELAKGIGLTLKTIHTNLLTHSS